MCSIFETGKWRFACGRTGRDCRVCFRIPTGFLRLNQPGSPSLCLRQRRRAMPIRLRNIRRCLVRPVSPMLKLIHCRQFQRQLSRGKSSRRPGLNLTGLTSRVLTIIYSVRRKGNERGLTAGTVRPLLLIDRIPRRRCFGSLRCGRRELFWMILCKSEKSG